MAWRWVEYTIRVPARSRLTTHPSLLGRICVVFAGIVVIP
jgi:hypothetical protein